jgi:hypothetical protein
MIKSFVQTIVFFMNEEKKLNNVPEEQFTEKREDEFFLEEKSDINENEGEKEQGKIIPIDNWLKPTTKSTWINSAKEIMDMGIAETPMLVEGLIPRYGVSALAGSSDLGKSYLLLQLADAIVNKDPDFLGFKLNAKHGNVIYVSTEDDKYSICPRLMNLTKNREDKDVYEQLKIITSAQNLIKTLDNLLSKNHFDCVFIDTFSDIFDGDMNQSNKVRFFLQSFKELANKYGTQILFNHHCGKKNDFRPPHKDNLLGSQGFESSMRTAIELRKDFTDSSLRHLCIVKANYLDETFKNTSFVLKFDYKGDGFTNTGRRVPFDQLAKVEFGSESKINRDLRVWQLQDEGKSYSEIAEIMKKEGIAIGKSTVGNICKNNPSIQPPKGKNSDGQDEPVAA